jgi:hypothetical protein
MNGKWQLPIRHLVYVFHLQNYPMNFDVIWYYESESNVSS